MCVAIAPFVNGRIFPLAVGISENRQSAERQIDLAGRPKVEGNGMGQERTDVKPLDKPILIYTTFSSTADAKRVGRALVESRLAACVNIFPGMISVFEWEGALDEADEVAMLIKTRTGLKQETLEAAGNLHPYDTPALLVLETSGGSDAFANWITEQTTAQSTVGN